MYVGLAKMSPASRSPRRLAIVISAIERMAISMRMSYRAGTTEYTWATAEAVETATVIT